MPIPQVSVIIPTYNRAGLLATAIRSVLDQTFSDFDLVVVDDGSDDSIDEVVKAVNDERVRSIRHEQRRGGAAARNTGIRNTDGEFVAFLDDDDEWYPQKLARQVSLLRCSNSNVGAVYTGYEVVNRDTRKVCGRKVPMHRGDISSALLEGNAIGTTSCLLLRRSCFEGVGMFDESLPSFQDYDLWIRLSRAYYFDYTSECLLNYHVHSDKVWTNPHLIREGLDILVEKYGTSRAFRKTCSRYYLSVAFQFCEMGKSVKAREAVRRAISLYPLDARHYLCLFFSLLSQPIYQKIQRTKASVLGSLSDL
jgi:glycosyltransferase involved in cell wall biosynthesis